MPRRGVAQQVHRAPRRQATSGRTVNFRNPAARSATTYTATVTNSGSVATSPTISIDGPLTATSVFFENVTAGKTVWINQTVGAGETLSVDFSTRTVTLEGVTVTGVVSVDSRWWELAPGGNTIRSNVAASVSHRDAYL